MSDDRGARPALRFKAAEIIFALFIMALGALILFDSVRIGARWTDDGPQTGYFPFYIALILCAACAVNLALALRNGALENKTFVEVGQLRLVLSVLVPAAVFVIAVPWLGLYLAAMIFVAYFMHRIGKYALWKAAATGIGTGVTLFLLFEVWFLVPLPKGPLERALNLG